MQGHPSKRVMFRIGYPNLGTFVEWETSPEDDAPLAMRIAKIWAYMQQYEAEGVWPKKVNDKCRWCPMRRSCSEYELATNDFNRTLERRTSNTSIGEQLEFTLTVRKMIEGKEDELKALLSAELATIPGGKVVHGDKVWYLETDERRSISASDTLAIMAAQINEIPELGPVATTMMDDIFTAKVGGIDKLIKTTGGAFGKLKDKIVKKPNKAPTLKSMPAGPLGAEQRLEKEMQQLGK